MAAVPQSANSALIEESRRHIDRLRVLIDDPGDQGRLALDLIAESQDYIEQVEDIEASRIERLAWRDEAERTASLIMDGSTAVDGQPSLPPKTWIEHQLAMVSRHVRESAARVQRQVERIDALRAMNIATDSSEKILAILRTTAELHSLHLAALLRERHPVG